MISEFCTRTAPPKYWGSVYTSMLEQFKKEMSWKRETQEFATVNARIPAPCWQSILLDDGNVAALPMILRFKLDLQVILVFPMPDKMASGSSMVSPCEAILIAHRILGLGLLAVHDDWGKLGWTTIVAQKARDTSSTKLRKVATHIFCCNTCSSRNKLIFGLQISSLARHAQFEFYKFKTDKWVENGTDFCPDYKRYECKRKQNNYNFFRQKHCKINNIRKIIYL